MLTTLITEAQSGNQDAMMQLITQFQPLLRKYSRRLNYEDSDNDLILLFIESIMRTNINSIKQKSEGALVSYIVKAVYHSYCILIKQAVAHRAAPYSLEELTDGQFFSSSMYHSPVQHHLDFPKGILTQREELILKQLYESELSVSEIAQVYHISRQAINQSKLRAESKLRTYYTSYNARNLSEATVY